MTTTTTTTDLLEALNDWTTRYNDPATRDAMVEGGANWYEDIVLSGDWDHLVDFEALDRHEETRSLVILQDGTAIEGDRGHRMWYHDTDHADNCEDCT